MITTATLKPAPTALPTIWGLDPVQLHDRFWAARGVQVVRLGEPSEIVADAELFLLTDPDALVLFRLTQLVDKMSWTEPRLMFVRLHDEVDHGYREVVVTDENDNFQTFQRVYDETAHRVLRVALTPDRDVALKWQAAASVTQGWANLRRMVDRSHRVAASVHGSAYDRRIDQELARYVRVLVQSWRAPDSTVTRAKRFNPGVWGDREALVDSATRFVGHVWIGAGRKLQGEHTVVGPTVLWDDPAQRPLVEDLHWQEIEPSEALARRARPRRLTSLQRASKRASDIVFALLIIGLTLPLYPLIMLAIWLEDGSPFFFAHRRETLGGREFPCLKFRSMRKDAEKIKQKLMAANQVDGPQFFMENDPRLTRVGRIIRHLNLDELPQLFNVLIGDMSIVGPRPSPYRENQYCPGWREARLSVRPGLTGLWQVKRSRAAGLDFQEWIRYDIEYVEKIGWTLDLWILWQTALLMLRRFTGGS
jgi:lipopolysaccharide/colanic/teichoic acid biosynthesis glycosyltransferase